MLSDAKLVTAAGPDEVDAPQSFAVTGDTFMVDDPGHAAIVNYVGGRRESSLNFSPTIRDMAACGAHFYVLTEDATTVLQYTLDAGGSPSAQGASFTVKQADLISCSDDSLFARLANGGAWVSVTGPDPAPTTPTFTTGPEGFTIVDGARTLAIPTRWTPGSIMLLDRSPRFATYLVTEGELTKHGQVVTHTFLYQVDAEGRPTRSFTLLDAPGFVPVRQVQIVGNAVYQLRVVDATVQIVELEPNP